MEMIARLTGDSEAVIRTNNLAVFAKLLQFVSQTSSTVASSPKSGPMSTGRNAVQTALDEIGIDRDEVSAGIDYVDPGTVIPGIPVSTSAVGTTWEDNDEDDW